MGKGGAGKGGGGGVGGGGVEEAAALVALRAEAEGMEKEIAEQERLLSAYQKENERLLDKAKKVRVCNCYGDVGGGRGGALLLLALVMWPLATHPFRDGAPFVLQVESGRMVLVVVVVVGVGVAAVGAVLVIV